MIKNNIVKLDVIKLFLTVIFSFIIIQGCGKKETTTNEEKKSDNKTETTEEKINLDKPVYVEFNVTGEMTGSIKAYYKTNKYKAETDFNTAGKEVKGTMICDGKTVYTISDVGGSKMGIKFDASKLSDPNNKNNNQVDISSFKDRMKDYKKVGEGEVLGKKCDIYQSINNDNRKLWVYQDLIPLKMESDKMTMTATKFETNVSINDDIFTPPGDVKFTDMGNMMENLSNPDKMKDMKNMQEQMKQMEEQMKNQKK